MDLETSGVKKKFNKRKYLKNKLKTNFGSRQEGHGQAFLQKQAIKQQYFRQEKREEKRRKKLHHMQLSKGNDELKKLELQCDDEQTKEDEDEESVFSQKLRKKKLHSWQRAKAEYHKKISENEQKKLETLKKRKEIEEATRKYKEKRLQRYKKLNQKTKKGQPIMSGRIELMLEQLQGEMNSN